MIESKEKYKTLNIHNKQEYDSYYIDKFIKKFEIGSEAIFLKSIHKPGGRNNPDLWILSGDIEEQYSPEDIYKIINPDNKYLTFEVVIGGIQYWFCNSIYNGVIERHYNHINF